MQDRFKFCYKGNLEHIFMAEKVKFDGRFIYFVTWKSGNIYYEMEDAKKAINRGSWVLI
jgi:hypothetical protein